MDIFAFRMKKLRKSKGITINELSKALDISRHTVLKYESAERSPNLEMLVEISEILQCSTDYLLGKSNIESPEVLLSLKKNLNITYDDLLKGYILNSLGRESFDEYLNEYLKQI